MPWVTWAYFFCMFETPGCPNICNALNHQEEAAATRRINSTPSELKCGRLKCKLHAWISYLLKLAALVCPHAIQALIFKREFINDSCLLWNMVKHVRTSSEHGFNWFSASLLISEVVEMWQIIRMKLVILTEMICAFVLWANYDGILHGEAPIWGRLWILHVGLERPQ